MFKSTGLLLTRSNLLLLAMAPILVPLLIAHLAWQSIVSGHDAIIINGTYSPALPLPFAWADLLATALVWAWAVTAGVIAADAVRRAETVQTRAVILLALRRTPLLTTVVPLLAAYLTVARIAPYIAKTVPTGVQVTVSLIALLICLSAASLAVSGSRLERILFRAFAVLAAPALLLWLTADLPVPRELTLTLIALLQAAAISAARAHRDDEFPQAAEIMTSRWWSPRLAVLILLPILIAWTIAVVNPYGISKVSQHEIGLSWSGPGVLDGAAESLVAAAWPAGQMPILMVDRKVFDCHDEVCSDWTEHPYQTKGLRDGGFGSYGAMATGTAPNGDILLASHPFSPGKPEVYIGRCTRVGVCADTTVETVSDDFAVAAGSDGAIYLAAMTAHGSSTRQELMLYRCTTPACPATASVQVANIEVNGRKDVQLSVNADGIASMTVDTGTTHYMVTCADAACREPTVRTEPSTYNQPHATGNQTFARLTAIGVQVCHRTCVEINLDKRIEAEVALSYPANGQLIAAIKELTPTPVGDTYWLRLSRCGTSCDEVLTLTGMGLHMIHLAVQPGTGRILVIQEGDHMMRLTAL